VSSVIVSDAEAPFDGAELEAAGASPVLPAANETPAGAYNAIANVNAKMQNKRTKPYPWRVVSLSFERIGRSPNLPIPGPCKFEIYSLLLMRARLVRGQGASRPLTVEAI
jgi:hypothetical protein